MLKGQILVAHFKEELASTTDTTSAQRELRPVFATAILTEDAA